MLKKLIVGFFAVLGFIFFCILLVLAYLIIADPFNLRPLVTLLLESQSSPVTQEVSPTTEVSQPSVSPGTEAVPAAGVPVTSEQAEALESVGLTPSSISADQEACFVRILGQERVDAVKAGDVPSASEFFSARECL